MCGHWLTMPPQSFCCCNFIESFPVQSHLIQIVHPKIVLASVWENIATSISTHHFPHPNQNFLTRTHFKMCANLVTYTHTHARYGKLMKIVCEWQPQSSPQDLDFLDSSSSAKHLQQLLFPRRVFCPQTEFSFDQTELSELWPVSSKHFSASGWPTFSAGNSQEIEWTWHCSKPHTMLSSVSENSDSEEVWF